MKKLILLLTPIILGNSILGAWGDNNYNRYNRYNHYPHYQPSTLDQFVDNHPLLFIGGLVTSYWSFNSWVNYTRNPHRSYWSHFAAPVTNTTNFAKRAALRTSHATKKVVFGSYNTIKNLGRWGYRHKYKIGGLCAAGAIIGAGIWATQQYECDICMEEKCRLSFTTLSCGHRYCTACLNRQINYGLRSQSMATLKCPDTECNRRFTNLVVGKIVGYFSPVRTQFQDLADREYLNSLPNSQQCPTPDCKHIMPDRGPNPHAVQCPECNQQYCSHCLLAHSPNISCREAKDQQLSDADKASEALARRISTPCPKCGINIQKNDGCNHMTCRQCRHEFCWLCLAPRKDYHSHICNPIGLLQRPGVALQDQQLIGNH